MYHDIMTHERLDRPQIRVFQRHPGTQLKEAQEIVRVSVSSISTICYKFSSNSTTRYIAGDSLIQ